MIKIFALLIVSVFIMALTIPSNYLVSDIITLPLSPLPGAYIETPPISVSQNEVIVTSNSSYLYEIVPSDLLSGLAVSSIKVSGRYLLDEPDKEWGRNYNGVYSALPLDNGSLLFLDHGENKNRLENGICYQNTINTNVLCQNCYSGLVNGVFVDCWQAYNGFVNLMVYTGTQTIDYGPIAWPVAGYLSDTTKSSHGLRHPHGIINDGYIYVFYRDQSYIGGGTKVARAPLTSYTPGNWQTYCNGNWANSLPAGFNKETIASFYSVRGGCASSILPTANNQVSFSVAKYEACFFGIEEFVNATSWGLNLWQSDNLVDWVFVQNVLSATGGWGAGSLHYPIFLAKDLSSNYEIDSRGFYIVGTRNGSVRMIYLAEKIKTFLPVVINNQ